MKVALFALVVGAVLLAPFALLFAALLPLMPIGQPGWGAMWGEKT